MHVCIYIYIYYTLCVYIYIYISLVNYAYKYKCIYVVTYAPLDRGPPFGSKKAGRHLIDTDY